MGRFAGKGVIVTGGARGIGRSIATSFAQEGAFVAIWDVDHPASVETAAEINRTGGAAIAVDVDVGSRIGVERALTRSLEAMHGVEILINNAAVINHGSILELTDDAWDTIMQTNLKGVFLCTQAVARHWVEEHVLGKIINVTSVDAAIVHVQFPHYCAAKAGVRSLTKASALELATHGIRVNEIAPGFIVPGMASNIVGHSAWGERVQSFAPLGRSGRADEIADAALFLAS